MILQGRLATLYLPKRVYSHRPTESFRDWTPTLERLFLLCKDSGSATGWRQSRINRPKNFSESAGDDFISRYFTLSFNVLYAKLLSESRSRAVGHSSLHMCCTIQRMTGFGEYQANY